jgi:hypothetical protein
LKSNFSEILFTKVYLSQLRKNPVITGFFYLIYGMYHFRNHNKNIIMKLIRRYLFIGFVLLSAATVAQTKKPVPPPPPPPPPVIALKAPNPPIPPLPPVAPDVPNIAPPPPPPPVLPLKLIPPHDVKLIPPPEVE